MMLLGISLMADDIRFILLITGIATLAILCYLLYRVMRLIVRVKHFVALVEGFMTNVPVLAPDDLEDLETRIKALEEYQHGNKKPLQDYWKNFYMKDSNDESR